jgi:hypothetical protein
MMQRMVAVAAVGPSAVRGQGKGVQRACQGYLASLPLGQISGLGSRAYETWLDRRTEKLLDALPIANRPWGTARKVLNLFMRDVLNNRLLSEAYSLDSLVEWLEIPLDSAVAKGLHRRAKPGTLPVWSTLKRLSPEVSRAYQAQAAVTARQMGIARVHLDMYLWLENRPGVDLPRTGSTRNRGPGSSLGRSEG